MTALVKTAQDKQREVHNRLTSGSYVVAGAEYISHSAEFREKEQRKREEKLKTYFYWLAEVLKQKYMATFESVRHLRKELQSARMSLEFEKLNPLYILNKSYRELLRKKEDALDYFDSSLNVYEQQLRNPKVVRNKESLDYIQQSVDTMDQQFHRFQSIASPVSGAALAATGITYPYDDMFNGINDVPDLSGLDYEYDIDA